MLINPCQDTTYPMYQPHTQATSSFNIKGLEMRQHLFNNYYADEQKSSHLADLEKSFESGIKGDK